MFTWSFITYIIVTLPFVSFSRYLNMAMDGEFGPQFVLHAFYYSTLSSTGQRVVWEYIQANYDMFMEK